jgi:hypothetical protein
VNALAKEEVGKYLKEQFVSTYQKVGTFRIAAGGQKQGGNVASYFCTPDGRVLHAIAGPVNSTVFLREARWVIETWKLAQLESQDDATLCKAFFRKAHLERLRQEHRVDSKKLSLPGFEEPTLGLTAVLDRSKVGNRKLQTQGRVHLLLASYPMVKLEQVYTAVFEKVLKQKTSTSPVVTPG